MGEVSFRYDGVPISLRTFGALDHISRIIETSESFYEIDVLKRSAEIYIPGTTIVDAGANIGNHTIFTLRFWEQEFGRSSRFRRHFPFLKIM